MVSALLDLLLPRRCVVCFALGADLCAQCRAELPLLLGTHCSRCGAPTVWPVRRCRECAGRRIAFASARAAVAYEAAVPAFVRAWKERGLRQLAAEAATVTAALVPTPRVEAIAFVPADGDRSVKRGHHPAARLAVELGRRWALPVVPVLARTCAPRPQRGLSLAERRRNVSGAFIARADAPRTVALVDDVYTTGSTASAAASALRRAGARRVEVVTFARTVRAIQSAGDAQSAIRGGRDATPGEGEERRGHRLDPRVRAGEALEARTTAGRPDAGRARAGGRAEPLDRREPHR